MEASLQARRQRAADRHDAALQAWPDLEGRFADEVRAVVAELEAIVAQMPGWANASVEWARTWRWLGDARSDLGQATADEGLLRAAWTAYDRADALLADAFDPVEQAKLLANWGNLSSRMAGTEDRAMLGRALRQYEKSRALFAANDPSRVPELDRRLADLRKLIKVFDLRQQLQAIPPPDPATATADQVQAFARSVADAEGQLGTVTDQAPGADRPERMLFRLLVQRAEADIAAGEVTPERATAIRQVLEELGDLVARPDADLATMMADRARLSELMLRVRELLDKGGSNADATTRASRVLTHLTRLKQAIGSMGMRTGMGEQDRARAMDLFVRAARAQTALEGAAANDASVVAIERDTLRPLAAEARRLSRLPNLTVARPDFRTGTVHASANTVAWSGPSWVGAPLDRVCQARGLSLQGPVRGEEAARTRWQQLREAGVGVFAFDDRQRGSRAAVAYELGLATAVGLPVVVLAAPGATVPFDVGVSTLQAEPSGVDEQALGGAIDAALYGIRAEPPLSDGIVATAREVIRTWGSSPVPGVGAVLRDLATKLDAPDAAAIEATLTGMWVHGQTDRPEFLVPAFPPSYPDPDRERLFHVMPFATAFDPVRDAVVELLKGTPVRYRRHDQVGDERILASLWEEIGRATHVLVELTGVNDNVVMELAVAHALGKPTLVVARGADEAARRALLSHLPDTLDKRRVRFYGDDLRELMRHVARFLRIHAPPAPAPRPVPSAKASAPRAPAAAPRPSAPAAPRAPTVPPRPGLVRIRAQFQAALARDQRENNLRFTLEQGFRMGGRAVSGPQLAAIVAVVRAYVAAVPDLLDAAWSTAVQQGAAAALDPILSQVEAYCDNPFDVFPDHLGLPGVVDDAYLARQVILGVEAMSRRSMPAVEQADQFLRGVIIGEPFGSNLDYMVAAILQGPAVFAALQQLAAMGGAAAWGGSMSDYNLNHAVDVALGAMGVV